MDAVTHERARAKKPEAGIDRRIARIIGKRTLDRGDLVEILVQMRLHQDGGEFLEQCAERRELLAARGDGETRRHRITLPAGAVPAPDEIAAVGDRRVRRREQSGRPVAVHHCVAGDHTGVAPMRCGEQRFGRDRMRRAIDDRGRRAVARQFVEEEFGVARGVRRIGEFLLLDESVFLQPFQQLGAVRGDHLGLREWICGSMKPGMISAPDMLDRCSCR